MGVSGYCTLDLHGQCPDTHEDLADCDCPCHLAQKEIICPTCGGPPEQYTYTAKVHVTYSIRTLQETQVWCDAESREDNEFWDGDYEWGCGNGHFWTIENLEDYMWDYV